MVMWPFRGSLFRSGSGYQIWLGDRAMGLLTRGTEESVLQVQLVPSFAGTDIEHMSFGVMMLLSVYWSPWRRVLVRQSLIDTYF